MYAMSWTSVCSDCKMNLKNNINSLIVLKNLIYIVNWYGKYITLGDYTMKKILKMSIINIPKWILIKRIIANIVSFLLLLFPAYFTRYLTDELIEKGRNIPYYWLLLVVVATFFIHIFIFYFVNYKGQVFTNQLAQDFEVKLMQKVVSSSNPEYEKESKSKIFNMHNNDIYSIYSLSNYLTMIPVDILEVIVIVGILFNVNYIIALVAILLAPLYVMSSFVNKKRLNELVADEKMAADEWIGETETIINGKVSIGLNKAQSFVMSRYNEKCDRFYKARNKQHFYLLITQELPQIITMLAPLIILVIGGNLVAENVISIGTLLYAMQIIGLVFSPLGEAASLQASLLSQEPVFKRARDFIDIADASSTPYISASGDNEAANSGQNGISISNVQMSTADGRSLFKIDSFNADKNGLILVRGENGCGKTTLLNVLSGIFDSTHMKLEENSHICVAKELCEDMAYLFYPDFLVKGTVKENVLCGRNIPEDNYRLMETILELPNAEKEVVLRPENLSLGEKQKIYLSRILVENKKCILLDEPGSNLDEKTEESLIQYLGQLKNDSLIIVISHNSKYDRIADKKYNINKGSMLLTK